MDDDDTRACEENYDCLPRHRKGKRGGIAFLETPQSENIGVAADFGEKLSVSDFPSLFGLIESVSHHDNNGT